MSAVSSPMGLMESCLDLVAWRRAAARVTLRPPWPLETLVTVARTRDGDVLLACHVKTKDARFDPGSPIGQPDLWVSYNGHAPLVTSDEVRIARILALVRGAILHEIDECLFVDDRRVRDPHGLNSEVTASIAGMPRGPHAFPGGPTGDLS